MGSKHNFRNIQMQNYRQKDDHEAQNRTIVQTNADAKKRAIIGWFNEKLIK